MERKEINSSIKLETLQNKLNKINEKTEKYKYKIKKVETREAKANGFNYEIIGTTRNGTIVFQKTFIDKIDVINFLDGIDFYKSIIEYKY